MRAQWRIAACAAALAAILAGPACADPAPSAGDRILVLAPHPDDEILGCGGIIQRALATGADVRVAFLTYGDNNEWSFMVYRGHPVLLPAAAMNMGRIRHDEAVRAAASLALPATNLVFLGYPDFGTLNIWYAHWLDRPAFRSLLTRSDRVPYENAWRPGRPYKGENILRDIEDLLKTFRPTKVYTSHPADFNADHLALYLFTRVAMWNVGSIAELYPYLVHYKHWPKPRGLRINEPLAPPAALTNLIAWTSFRLRAPERAAKNSALEQHRTQVAYSSGYLHSFVRANELFGDFPPVTLRPTTNDGATVLGESTAAPEPPDQLTDQERASFVGYEERTVRLDGNGLELTLRFSRPLAEAVRASVHVFGYRSDRPFARMPKLHVAIGALGETVDDQGQKLPKGRVTIARRAREIVIRIPLDALGNPERILTNARTYFEEVPLDSLAWRVLELPVVDAGKD